jgi:hypothetical protein
MRPSRAFTAAAVAALALAAGCSTDCQDLANRICGCTLVGPSRDACEKQAKDQLKAAGVDEAFCAEKLGSCHDDPVTGATLCELLNTEQGKAACGIAYPPYDGGGFDIPDGGVPDGGAPDAGP